MKTRFHHFAIRVKSLEVSINFYCNILGLSLVEEYSWKDDDFVMHKLSNKIDSSGKAIMLGTGNAFFELIEYHNSPGPLPITPPAHICLQTDNIEKMYSHITSHGIEVLLTPHDTGLGTFLTWLHDPDGNLVELLEIYSNVDKLNFDFSQ